MSISNYSETCLYYTPIVPVKSGKYSQVHNIHRFLGMFKYLNTHAAAPPGFRFGGNTVGGRPPGGPRRSPADAGEFSKIFKNFLKKIAKMHYFSIFFKIIHKPCVNFSCVWTKNTIFGKF